jgi:NAD(P)-dependent dehydrogenase (short-subunit alcohol dehydrogenase family)
MLDFSGRNVVLTGASAGMGAAARRLFLRAGATVHAVDIAEPAPPTPSDAADGNGDRPPPVHLHRCDLGRRESIDGLVAELPDRVDALVNCAGIPNGGRFSGEEVMRVNWLGLRHLTESLLDRLEGGGAVVNVASTAGRDWAARRLHHEALMAAATFEEGLAWVEANPDVYGDGYAFSKEAVQFYTLWRSVQLLPRNIRMNSICPGITDTSIFDDFRRGVGDDVLDHARAVAGRIASPEEMAPAMLFLADEASSSYVNGVNLNIDRGTGAARITDQSDPERIWGSAGPIGAGDGADRS